MFAYYAKWIPHFSDIVQPLLKCKTFPLDEEPLEAFKKLKEKLLNATLHSIDESVPFVVECDASDIAISAVLNQRGRPVAFMSRTLQSSEKHYPAVEKEATAIIEAVRKWSHLLARQPFTLITDQQSVAYMLDNRRRTKVKNNKIQGWRIELASFGYTIKYRPGKENTVPDTLTRAFSCSTLPESNLKELHNGLCHPGVTRLLHFVRSRNLPYSTEDVKRVCAACRICAMIKPRFFQPLEGRLIKATQPMERLSIDFKGPLPSTKAPYMLTVVDEFSRFPFAFPCPNMSSNTVIKCLEPIFSFCGVPDYIHSDRGTSFMSRELKEYLTQRGVATSRTTPYHPTGNAQVEKYNGIIWKAIQLNLRTNNRSECSWEQALPDVLHSIRSLLCTATNATPHERFFNFKRRSTYGSSLPRWLTSPGPVFLRRFVRQNKNEDLVEEVDLIEANPTYASIRYSDGRESTVSVRDLAPCPGSPENPISHRVNTTPETTDRSHTPNESSNNQEADTRVEVRKSNRASKPPERYG